MKLIFSIDLQGNVTNRVEDAEGLSCLDAAKPFEDALGDPDPERTMTVDTSNDVFITQVDTLTQSF
jgi:hypothetical protein